MPRMSIPIDAVEGIESLKPGDEVTVKMRVKRPDADEEDQESIEVEVMSGDISGKNVARADNFGGNVRPASEGQGKRGE